MQPPARALTVLVVEDHAPLREQIALLLRSAGHRVDEASDGRLALACALQSPPDVLVLDLGLPGLSGLALCRQLRKQAAQPIPVLMLTARDTLPDKLEGFAAGADDYLTKPLRQRRAAGARAGAVPPRGRRARLPWPTTSAIRTRPAYSGRCRQRPALTASLSARAPARRC